jgi:uncharacterized protein (TIGR00730 family)
MPYPALSVCVYCGSRPGRLPAYSRAATAFGTALAAEGWTLVYGAGDIGLMGDVARATQAGGGTALGIIPQHLVGKEQARRSLSRLIITETMHERKKVMFMNADAVAVLPGGAGTLDEFFEVLTWAQLGLHAKPIVLLNIDGYWDPLLSLLRHVVAEELAPASLTTPLRIAADVAEAIEALRAFRQPSQE